MTPISFSALNSKLDKEPSKESQAKLLAGEGDSPVQQGSSKGLQDMPYEVLLKIISFIFTHSSEEQLNSRSELEKAAHTLNALAGVNQRLRQIAKDRYTIRMVTRDSLDAFGSLGQLDSKEMFSNVLNLDLELLEEGVNLYLKELNNKFSKIFSLAQEVKKLAFTLVKEANEVFKREDFSPVVLCAIIRDFEDEGFKFRAQGFKLLITLSQVLIYTPFQLIKIEDHNPESRPIEEATDLPSLAIAEVLINRLQATFNSTFFDSIKDPCYELSKPNAAVCHVRRVKFGELIRVESMEALKNARGSQRVISRDENSNSYVISQIGDWWEGYVLETANSLYKNRGVPSRVSKMIEA